MHDNNCRETAIMNELVHFLFHQSENTRAVLYAFTGQFLIYYMAEKMLVRRHSRIPLYICLIIKTLMVYPTELYFLAHPELNAAESLGFFIYSSWRDTIVTGLSLWTYSRNNGKTGLTFVIGEMGAVLITLPIIVVLNILEKRSSPVYIAGPFMLPDLLIPVIFGVIWIAIRKPLLKIAQRYRNWKPRHPGLLWGLFFLYWFSSIVSQSGSELVKGASGRLMLLHQIWCIVLMGLLMGWLLYQQREENERHAYLLKQDALAKAYDRILGKNRETAENLQRQIREQTEQLSRHAQEGERPESGQMHAYLKELQEEAGNLQISGVYCGNYLVDAVLCMEQQMLEKLGYQADFRCVNVPEHMEDTATLPQIVELVCEEWMEQKKGRNARAGSSSSENKNICHLQITAARGQILITANIPGKWNRGRQRLLKGLISGRGGSFLTGQQKRSPETGMGSVIMLPVEPGNNQAEE